jgi:hypothetical protein
MHATIVGIRRHCRNIHELLVYGGPTKVYL